jgi:putative ABC transport system permease protein
LPFALAVGLQTLRRSPLHTLLSTLGIVVGVAALVAILSLGDGLEEAAREQIESTTDLQLITATPRAVDRIDGISVRKANIPVFELADVEALQGRLGRAGTVTLAAMRGAEVYGPTGKSQGAILTAVLPNALDVAGDSLAAGRFLTSTDVDSSSAVAVLSSDLAEALVDSSAPLDLLHRVVTVGEADLRIVGTLAPSRRTRSRVYVPFGAPVLQSPATPPALAIKVAAIEDVSAVRDTLDTWLAARFGTLGDFDIATNEWRVSQSQRAVLLFKLIMGAITGISIFVGGIGVMNVLLVSIAQRTREIGVRRAAGARRRDVLLQFLVESVAISGAGSVIGLAVGFGAVVAFVPIVRHITDIPFRAGFSVSTVVVVLAAAIVVGVMFGTYPAWRAAQLEPVDALRHE